MTTRIHISAHQKAILRHITRYGFITPREARAIVWGVDPKIGAYVRRKKSKRDRRPAWAQVQALPLTATQAAHLLRLRNVGTIYHLVQQQRIPVIKLSARCIRFSRKALLDWIESMSQPAHSNEFMGSIREESGVAGSRSKE
jgi:excisionase family DNA binding protein